VSCYVGVILTLDVPHRRRHPLPLGVAWMSSSVGHRTPPLPHWSEPGLGSGLDHRRPWCAAMNLVAVPRCRGPGRHLVDVPRPCVCSPQVTVVSFARRVHCHHRHSPLPLDLPDLPALHRTLLELYRRLLAPRTGLCFFNCSAGSTPSRHYSNTSGSVTLAHPLHGCYITT